MKVEETVYFELSDGRTIFVKDLSQEIQQQIQVLDRLRQDTVNKSYEMQVYATALEVKKKNIQQALEEFLKKQVQKNKDAVVENDTP